MDTGYDPQRVRALSHRTAASIEELRSIRSDDPAAAEAVRAVKLTRRNLEDLWMPTLLQIARSDAMVSWTDADLDHAVHWWIGGRPLSATAVPDLLRPEIGDPLTSLTDDQLLGYLMSMDRREGAARAERLAESDDRATATIRRPDLDTLATELAVRVARSPLFAHRLAAVAPDLQLLGLLTGRAAFPVEFLSAVVRSMTSPDGPIHTADLDHYATSMSSVLAALVDDPGACLDLLLDGTVLGFVAGWDRLDPDTVTAFATSGLRASIVADEQRLGDGYEVLAMLTQLANGRLQHGMSDGMSIGVALSMTSYIDTLAPAIGGSDCVVVSNDARDLDVTLGSLAELDKLIGLLLRNSPAQAALGAALGAYTTRVISDLGPDLIDHPAKDAIEQFTALVDRAAVGEQAQLVMEAAAEEAWRGQMGRLIALGANAGLLASGIGVPLRGAASSLIEWGTTLARDVEPERLAGASLAAQNNRQIFLVAVGVAVVDPNVLRRADLAPLTPAQTSDLSKRLAEIDDTDDPDARSVLVDKLRQHINEAAPLSLGTYLQRADITLRRSPPSPSVGVCADQ